MADSTTFGWILVVNIVLAAVSIGFSAAAFGASSRDLPSNDASFRTVNTHLASIEGDFAAQSCFLTYTASPWQLTEEKMREYIKQVDWTIGVPKYSSARKACVCEGADDSNPLEADKGFTPVWIAPGDLIDHTTTGGLLESYTLPTNFVSDHKYDYDPTHHVKICLEQDRIAALWNSGRCHNTKTDGIVDRIYTGWDGDLFCAGSNANSPPSAPPSAPLPQKMPQTDLVSVLPEDCVPPNEFTWTTPKDSIQISFWNSADSRNSTTIFNKAYDVWTISYVNPNGANCGIMSNYIFNRLLNHSDSSAELSESTPVQVLTDTSIGFSNSYYGYCNGDCISVRINATDATDDAPYYLVAGDLRSFASNTLPVHLYVAIPSLPGNTQKTYPFTANPDGVQLLYKDNTGSGIYIVTSN